MGLMTSLAYKREMHDIHAIRLERLRQLATEAGGAAKLAKRLEISESQMSQLIGKNPVRNVGGVMARRCRPAG